jgi:hypothetical protein
LFFGSVSFFLSFFLSFFSSKEKLIIYIEEGSLVGHYMCLSIHILEKMLKNVIFPRHKKGVFYVPPFNLGSGNA